MSASEDRFSEDQDQDRLTETERASESDLSPASAGQFANQMRERERRRSSREEPKPKRVSSEVLSATKRRHASAREASPGPRLREFTVLGEEDAQMTFSASNSKRMKKTRSNIDVLVNQDRLSQAKASWVFSPSKKEWVPQPAAGTAGAGCD